MTNQHKKSNLNETFLHYLPIEKGSKEGVCIVNPENDGLISPELMVAILGTAYSYTPTESYELCYFGGLV